MKTLSLLWVASLALGAGSDVAEPGTQGGAETVDKPNVWVPPADEDGFVTVIDLVTVGPGTHLWTSFGHTALMVMRFNRATKEYHSKVYNWGDADFGTYAFMFNFLRGKARFRITEFGSVEKLVNAYARINRTIGTLSFALTSEQAQKVADRLVDHARPDNREYVYHHINATCATKLRDFLDAEIVDGAIAAHFGDTPDDKTPRQYGRHYFAGFFFGELFSDVFMGREHDRQWTKWDAMTVPFNLTVYLQEVQVPDPAGTAAMVPLLSAPVPIVHDVPPRPYRGAGRSLIHLTYAFMLLVGALGLVTVLRRGVPPRYAGVWLASWSVLTTFAAACMVFGAIVSVVIEGRINELMLVFPITDLVLLPFAWRWWCGSTSVPKWLRIYVWSRAGLIALSLLGHATGVLFQEPRIVLVFALECIGFLLIIVHRLPKSAELAEIIATPKARASAA